MALTDQNELRQQMTMLAPVLEDKDLATKEYVDAKISGMMWTPAAAGTTSNLTATYDNGAKTLTADASGILPAIDGVTLAINDRVLVKDQSDKTQNGVYVVTDLGSVSTPWIMTRAEDADSSDEFKPGKTIYLMPDGTTQGDTTYKQVTAGTVTIGTTPIEYAYDTPDTVRMETLDFIGDDTTTVFNINHTLSTKNVIVQTVRTDVTPWATTTFGVFFPSTAQIRLTANPAPVTGEEFKVNLLGVAD